MSSKKEEPQKLRKDCVGESLKVGDTVAYVPYGGLNMGLGKITKTTPKAFRIDTGFLRRGDQLYKVENSSRLKTCVEGAKMLLEKVLTEESNLSNVTKAQIEAWLHDVPRE